ncbi:putative ubiquitin-conjugating enzyme E2, ubiquitin-conjugating enzyme/RWD [Helianthus anomalus]
MLKASTRSQWWTIRVSIDQSLIVSWTCIQELAFLIKKDVLPHPSDKTSQIARVDDDVLDRYKHFKGFEIIKGPPPPDNLFFGSNGSKYGETEKVRTVIGLDKTICEAFFFCLVSKSIFVRAYKSKIDVLTTVIIGQKGTAYHDGLFFIDVIFRGCFPEQAPLFRLCSFGYDINPHMFECGQVCLRLSHQCPRLEESIWVPLQRTVYDVLCGASGVSEYFSFLYNENVRIKSLKIMTCIMNKPPKNFEAFVIGHFRNRAKDIMKDCTTYVDGLKAGNGEGNNSCYCSHEFRVDVASCIPELNNSVNKIGATFDDVCSLTPAVISFSPSLSIYLYS